MPKTVSPKPPKQRNGAGSCFYSAGRGAWLASYSRGLDADRRPIVRRFQAPTEQGARDKRDRDEAAVVALEGRIARRRDHDAASATPGSMS